MTFQLPDWLHAWFLPAVLFQPWQAHTRGQTAGGFAALAATLLSLDHITRHLRHNDTKLRKCTIRILLVVPIFAIDSWVALVLTRSENNWPVLLTGFREIYESVAMFSFMQYVLTFLGGAKKLVEKLAPESMHEAEAELNDHLPCCDKPTSFRQHVSRQTVVLGDSDQLKDSIMNRQTTVEDHERHYVHHVWPLNRILSPHEAGADFVFWTITGIFQYLVISILLFFVSFGLWYCDIIVKEQPKPGIHITPAMLANAVPNGIKAVSCAWALYNLAFFYHETMNLLAPIKPCLKFICIKGVIFFTFWQGIAITVALKSGAFNMLANESWNAVDVAEGLKNFLLCFEMLFFSLMHRLAYPANEARREALCADIHNFEEFDAPAEGLVHHMYVTANQGMLVHKAAKAGDTEESIWKMKGVEVKKLKKHAHFEVQDIKKVEFGDKRRWWGRLRNDEWDFKTWNYVLGEEWWVVLKDQCCAMADGSATSQDAPTSFAAMDVGIKDKAFEALNYMDFGRVLMQIKDLRQAILEGRKLRSSKIGRVQSDHGLPPETGTHHLRAISTDTIRLSDATDSSLSEPLLR